MSLFALAGVLIFVVAILGVINYRTVKLPDTLGITLFGLMASTIILLIGKQVPGLHEEARHLVDSINFEALIFEGILGLLLFAGSLHVNINDLKDRFLVIALLATISVVISTIIIGYATFYLLAIFGLNISLVHCMMFGALISPTDPIAVLAILKNVCAPKNLETDITGESLFNDGTGVVAFQVLLGIAVAMKAGNASLDTSVIVKLLITEVIGALGLGLVIGFGATKLLKLIDSYAVEILITLSIPTAGYALAEHVHASAPLTVVVAGLIIGNRAVTHAMSETTRERMLGFWDLIDELLNLMLFGLVGVKLLSFNITATHLAIGAISIAICLIARFISVSVPILCAKKFIKVEPHTIKIFTWGGLRGAISVALALSLPVFEGKEFIVVATYLIVVFSLLVQALTLGKLMTKWNACT